jgi:hypothetical protein
MTFRDRRSYLVAKLERLHAGCDLRTTQAILSDLFGERPTVEAVKSLNRTWGKAIAGGKSFYQTSGGGQRTVTPSKVSTELHFPGSRSFRSQPALDLQPPVPGSASPPGALGRLHRYRQLRQR